MNYVHRHVLEDLITGFEGRSNPHHLAVLRRPTVFSILARPGREADARNVLANLQGISVRISGPGEWLVVSEDVAIDNLARTLQDSGAGLFDAVDQSDGRVVLRLSGPQVRKILAKCLAVDLHADAFPVGASAATQCCHAAANLARTDQDTFELVVSRSFAGFVFEEILEMGREFTMTAGFSAG
ncbi:MAG: sarcosine oxidase subunit gamma [Rhizobium sp. 63-7]|nr:MAG: sarcosine oxidase subunit gamma [Rhizobium sp. 63-7]